MTALAGAAWTAAVAAHGGPLAAAASPSVGNRRVAVPMSLTQGFTLPQTVGAGWITFETSTTDVSAGFLHYLQGFQTRPGVTPEQVVDDLRLALSSVIADRIRGSRRLQRDAVLIGGAAPAATTPVAATLPLTAGAYHFCDVNDFFVPGQEVTLHQLEVTGPFAGARPATDATVVMSAAGGTPRYLSRRTLPAGGTLRVINRSSELHELALQRLLPGATDADIARFYASGGQGESPFADFIMRGLATLSPGREALLRVGQLGSGPFVMQCFAPDSQTGLPHTVGGMHRAVRFVD